MGRLTRAVRASVQLAAYRYTEAMKRSLVLRIARWLIILGVIAVALFLGHLIGIV